MSRSSFTVTWATVQLHDSPSLYLCGDTYIEVDPHIQALEYRKLIIAVTYNHVLNAVELCAVHVYMAV